MWRGRPRPLPLTLKPHSRAAALSDSMSQLMPISFGSECTSKMSRRADVTARESVLEPFDSLRVKPVVVDISKGRSWKMVGLFLFSNSQTEPLSRLGRPETLLGALSWSQL